MRNINSTLGFALITFGLLFTIFNYLITLSTPLIATGIAIIIIGLALSLLPDYSITKKTIQSILNGSMLNIEAILEQLDIKEKAVFIPTEDNKIVAYIPLTTNPHPPKVEQYFKAPRTIITKAGENFALMIYPPASDLIKTEELEKSDLENALNYILCELTELCGSVKVVNKGDEIVLEISGIKSRTEAARYKLSFGSLPVSLASCAIASLKKKATSLIEEKGDLKKTIARIKIYNG